ncbi:MAG: YfhO family protein [Anaerolineae bacterium]
MNNRLRTRHWLRVVTLLCLILLPALFFWRILTPKAIDRATFPPGDLTLQYYPLRVFAARELVAGRLPLWNPYIYAGQPGLADIQTAALYPVNLLTALLLGLLQQPFSFIILEGQIILHFSLVSLFTYLFVRRLTGNTFAALVAACTFTYGGYLTSFPVQQPTILATAVWLPLILLLLDKGVVALSTDRPSTWRTRVTWVTLAGVTLGVAILAGHPQTVLYVFYASLLYLAYRSWPAKGGVRQAVLPFLGYLGLFTAVGVGLAAVQVLPSLEFMRLSTRSALSYEYVSTGFFFEELSALIAPGYFGGSPQYVGIIPLVLTAMALLFDRTHRDKAFWAGLGLIAFLLSFGGHTFLYTLLYLLAPGFGSVRNQERVIFLFNFSVAILAGYGSLFLIQTWPERMQQSVARFNRLLGRIAMAVLGLIFAFFYGSVSARQGGVEIDLYPGVLRHLVPTLLLLVLAWSLLGLKIERRISPPWLKSLLLVAILWNLFSVNWQYNLADPPPKGHFPDIEVARFLRDEEAKSGEGFRVTSGGLLPGGNNAGAVYAFEDIAGNSPLHLERYEEFIARVSAWPAWQLLNVHYVVTRDELEGDGFRRVFQEGDLKVYEITDPVPAAYVVHQAMVADGDEAWQAINAPDFDSRRLAVLAKPFELSLPSGEVTGSTVQVVTRSSGLMVLEVNLVENGLLVLSQIHNPGWRALANGESVPLLRADQVLQAIPLEKGSYRVEVVYQPATFTAGVIISTLTLLGVMILVAFGLREG